MTTNACRYTLIDEATEDNGCLWVVPRSHRHGILSRGDLTSVVDKIAAVPVTGQPGDCLLFRCVTHICRLWVSFLRCISRRLPAWYLELIPHVHLHSTYTVHGSYPNTTDRPRRAYINGFVRRGLCTRAPHAGCGAKFRLFVNGLPCAAWHTYAVACFCFAEPRLRVGFRWRMPQIIASAL